MKFRHFMYAAMMGGLLASCSQENLGDEPNPSTGEGVQSYISVNIYNSNASTRADEQSGEPASEGALYEDGTGNENDIKTVRFFFFNNAGNPVQVRYAGDSSPLVNYYDYTNNDQDLGTADATNPNVEKLVAAQVVLSTERGDNLKLPTKMVAVINPDQAFLDETNKTNYSLAQLKELAKDYATPANAGNNVFPMVNSVYADAAGNTCFENDVTGYIYEEGQETTATPVEIYVERTVAKVTLSITDATQSGDYYYIPLYADKDKTTRLKTPATGKDLYLKVAGWDVASYTDKSRLVKDIEGIYAQKDNFSFTLNYPAYFRSFWANNAEGVANKWTDGWNGLTTALDGHVYVNENTNETSIDNYTKVVIGAQLCTKKDETTYEPFTYIKWGGASYDQATFENQMLSWIEDQVGTIYKKTTEGGTVSYSKLTAADLEIKTAKEYKNDIQDKEYFTENASNKQYGDNAGVRYKVYITLKDKEAEYYKDNAENTTNNWTVENIENGLKGFGDITYYKDGMCYYYFPIEHLGDGSKDYGNYGVVRNHVYKCDIQTITGLGTAVYDPEEVIYPEKPKDTNYYLKAAINVLSWRIVKKNYNLNW